MKRFFVFGFIASALVALGIIGGMWLGKKDRVETLYTQTTSDKPTLTSSISRGIEFLISHQKQDGSFPLLICDSTEPERCDEASSAPMTGGVLIALEGVKDSRLDQIHRRGTEYILHSMETTPDGKHATWNLFSPLDPRHSRIPGDIDVSSVLSGYLARRGIEYPHDIEGFRPFQNTIGLYHNWISTEWNLTEKNRHSFAGGSEKDFSRSEYFGVDCMVNADVLWYLATRHIESEPLCTYIKDVIQQKDYPQCTFYYRSPYLFLASVARAHEAGAQCLADVMPRVKEDLISTARNDGTWTENFFGNIAATMALVKTGYRGPVVDRSIEKIIAAQQENGGWGNAVVFPDLYNPVFYGSQELVAASVIELLSAYQQQQ
ncbi:MAG: hypothetical protein AAB372_02720 [Patescibacteria group bacterium]